MNNKDVIYEKLLILCPSLEYDLFEILVDECISEFVSFCNRQYTSEANMLITKMFRHKYNRFGNEALASQNVAGQSESYSSNYDEIILKELRSFRSLII